MLTDDGRNLDVNAVAELVEASRALTSHANIKGCHTVARKKTDEAGRTVEDLVGEVDDFHETPRR